MSLDKQTSQLVSDLLNFMREKFEFDRDPKIHFIADSKNAKNPLAKTGHYDPEAEEIVVYTKERHPKDILRSVAHELLHHVQKCEGGMENHDMSATEDPNYIMHDEYLKMIEADAFERGNIAFREWEAYKKGDKTMLQEKKKLSKRKLKTAHKHAKSALKHGGFEQYGDRAKEVAYATMTKQALRESSDWGTPEEILNSVMSALERYVEWPLSEIMEYEEVQSLLQPIRDAINEYPLERTENSPEEADSDAIFISGDDKMNEEKTKKSINEDVEVNEALKNSHNYNTITRAMPNVSKARDEFVYEELLKKFKIKK